MSLQALNSHNHPWEGPVAPTGCGKHTAPCHVQLSNPHKMKVCVSPEFVCEILMHNVEVGPPLVSHTRPSPRGRGCSSSRRFCRSQPPWCQLPALPLRDRHRGSQHLYLLLPPSSHPGTQSPWGELVFSLPQTFSPSRSCVCPRDPSPAHEETPLGFFKPELRKSVPPWGKRLMMRDP